MPHYAVKVKLAQTLEKPIMVTAADEDEAMEKAVDVVLKWNNVDDAEAFDVEEV